MEDLPDEIVERIISGLQERDLRNVRLVCYRLRNLSYARVITRRIITVIVDYKYLINTYYNLSTFTAQFRPINMALDITSGDGVQNIVKKRSKQFWKRYGERIRMLKIVISIKSLDLLMIILCRCPNLEELYITTPDRVNQPKIQNFRRVNLQKLKILSILGEHKVFFPLLREALIKATLLTEIIFICCLGYCSLWGAHPPLHNRNAAFNRKLHLKKVNIQCSTVDNILLNLISRSIGKSLESICVANVLNRNLVCLRYLEHSCQDLRELLISHWEYTTFFWSTFRALYKLTAVSLSLSPQLDDDQVVSLSVLPYITHLCLAFCHVRQLGIFRLFQTNIGPRLIELRLIGLQISDNLINDISVKLYNLKVLNLAYCEGLTTNCIEDIANCIPSLQCLNFQGCNMSGRPNMMFPTSINKLKNLVHFSCKGLFFLSIACGLHIRLPRLKVLDMVTVAADLPNLIRRNPSLKFVNQICCETRSEKHPLVAFIRRKNILECYNSPFGLCNLNHLMHRYEE